jgi:hypothetical protein
MESSTSNPSKESLRLPVDLQEAITFLAALAEDQQDYITSLTTALDRNRQVVKSVIDKLNKSRWKDWAIIDRIQECFGPLHEEIIRQAVATSFGLEWGASINIQGFTDAISFAGRGLALSTTAHAEARDVLLRRFCWSFEGFDVKLSINDVAFQQTQDDPFTFRWNERNKHLVTLAKLLLY